tara:strand:- start:153 stop:407 length:255 start_codon:yes stop_codon:yes gene_type:complete
LARSGFRSTLRLQRSNTSGDRGKKVMLTRIKTKLFGISGSREAMILEKINRDDGIAFMSIPKFTSWAMIAVFVFGFLAGIVAGS